MNTIYILFFLVNRHASVLPLDYHICNLCWCDGLIYSLLMITTMPKDSDSAFISLELPGFVFMALLILVHCSLSMNNNLCTLNI